MSIEIIKQEFNHIINPATSKSLISESRLVAIEQEGDFFVIRYKRDGITPLDKRQIEQQISSRLVDKIDIEKLKIYTISDRSKDVFNSLQSKLKNEQTESKPVDTKSSADTSAANIKVGHGQAMNKKPVQGVKNLIAIGSGKGGVGKSTFSANLAKALVNAGKKVGLIDADIYGPSLPMLMGKRNEKPMSNTNKKIIPLEAHGIKFISFGLFINESDPVIWRGPMLGGVLNQFLFDVDWGELDYLLIDLPPGTGDIQLSMVQNTVVNGAIIISTPQDVALLDAAKGLEMFNKMNLPILGMVENMSYFICDGCGKEHHIFGNNGVNKTSEKLKVPFLGHIPLELDLRLASDSGELFMANNKFEQTKTWAAYTEIAKKISNDSSVAVAESKSTSLFGKLFGKP